MKLYQAIILSLLCHGLLLLPSTEQPLPDVTVSPIQVVILANDQSKVKQTDTTSQSRTQTHEPQTKPYNRSVTATTETSTSIQAVSQKPHRPAETPRKPDSSTGFKVIAAVSRQHAQSYVISRLHHQIDNYFIYPMLARRNGWEGRVILALDVNLGGQIKNVQVKSGSGHPVLDRSALNALSRIRTIPDMPYWQGPPLLNVNIPVIYRLQG
jgi:protein TonB